MKLDMTVESVTKHIGGARVILQSDDRKTKVYLLLPVGVTADHEVGQAYSVEVSAVGPAAQPVQPTSPEVHGQ